MWNKELNASILVVVFWVLLILALSMMGLLVTVVAALGNKH